MEESTIASWLVEVKVCLICVHAVMQIDDILETLMTCQVGKSS